MVFLVVNAIFSLLLLRQIIVVLLAFWTYHTGDAPFKSTETSVIKQLLRQYALPACPIYDLGSGSGKAIFSLAQALPNDFVGVEKNLLLTAVARWRAFWHLGQRARFRFLRADIFTVDLRTVQCIYLYLSPKANQKLRVKFETELAPGALILALRFPFVSPQFRLMTTLQTKYPFYIYEKRKAK